jgi:hypothetical protein
MRRQPVYVEITIRGDINHVWQATQDPALHQRWDLRFSQIQYLPRELDIDPQRFRYLTRIGFGRAIEGAGESTGQKESETGELTSALRFWSDDPLSLIEIGSGYWKYVPVEGGVRFFTWYDYQTRFGKFGEIFDQFIFRPLIKWATAWSFDRLRLWIETGLEPEVARALAIVDAVSRVSLALIWIYQGLIPKLLYPDYGEIQILRGAHLFRGYETPVLLLAGGVEMFFGLLMLILWDSKRILEVNIIALLVLLVGGVFAQPALLAAPFNPISLTLAMIALALAGLAVYGLTPSATRSIREGQP